MNPGRLLGRRWRRLAVRLPAPSLPVTLARWERALRRRVIRARGRGVQPRTERRYAVTQAAVTQAAMNVPAEAAPTELEARFEAFVSSQRPRALRLAWRLVGAQDAAEDVMQEALLKAYRGLSSFRGEASLETWFYRILVRQAHSYSRWRAVRERWGGLWVADELPDPAPRAERDSGLRRQIAEAMGRLPRTQRDAFVLVHLEGFTVTEAAELMGKAPGTVKSHLHRALSSLRARLEGLL